MKHMEVNKSDDRGSPYIQPWPRMRVYGKIQLHT